MAIDWFDSELDHELVVEMVDPNNHDAVLGLLEVNNSGSVRYDDTTETVVSASLDVPNWSLWIDGSWLRIIHQIRNTDYRRVLGTFFVWDKSESFDLNYYGARPQLYSVLKALELDSLEYPLFVSNGASVEKALRAVCDGGGFQCGFSGDFGSPLFTATHVYDAGADRLSTLCEIAEIAEVNVTTDERGYPYFEPRRDPASKVPAFIIDANAPNTCVLESSVSLTDDRHQKAGRVVVVFNDTEGDDEYSISAYADVASSSRASFAKRGFRVTEVHELSEMTYPRTTYHAQQLAREYLKEDSRGDRIWSVRTSWLPLQNGDVVMWCPPQGAIEFFKGTTYNTSPVHERVKCVVTTCECDFANWQMSLELTELV